MNINPRSIVFTPIQDLIITSGVNLLPEMEEPLRRQVEARVEGMALETLRRSYETHEEELRRQDYSQFLQKVQTNLAIIDSPRLSSERRLCIAEKLRSLAEQRIHTKEKSWKFFFCNKLFEKLGQFWQGHGFQTRGQWGIELSNKIKEWDRDELHLAEMKDYIEGDVNPPPSQLLEKINQLNSKDFKKFADTFLDIQENRRFCEKNKLKLYNAIDPDKKQTLSVHLSRSDFWVHKAFDIIEGGNLEQMKDFIQANPHMLHHVKYVKYGAIALFDIYNYKEYTRTLNASFIQFHHTFIELATRSLAQDPHHSSAEKQAYIERLWKLADNRNMMQEILANPKILSQEEIQSLKRRASSNFIDLFPG